MGATENTRMKQRSTRLIIAFLVLIGLNTAAWFWGDRYVRLLLPVYQWSFETLTPYFKVQSLRIEQENGEQIVRVRARTAGSRQLAGQWIQAGVPVSSSTLTGHALQHVIVLFTVISLWPVRVWWERGVLVVLAVPALMVVEALDIPLVLAGALEDLVLFNFDPDRLSLSFLVQGMHFMNNGGRIVVSLIGAALTGVAWHAIRNIPASRRR